MNIMDYIDFVKARLKEAHDKNNKEEFVRLMKVLREALDDKIVELAKEM